MGRASFGGSQDLSSLFSRIGASQADSVTPTKTAKTPATKTYTVKPKALHPVTASYGGSDPGAALAMLNLRLTKGEIDEFEYADEEEAIAASVSDSEDRTKLLEHAYKMRQSAMASQDDKFKEGWSGGMVSDQEYLDYLTERLDGESNPEARDNLVQNVTAVSNYISDAQAVRKWKAGGPIQDIVMHYKNRMEAYPVDSPQRRSLEEEYWKYLDEMQKGQYEDLSQKLSAQVAKGDIDEAQALKALKAFRATVRPGSSYAKSMDQSIKGVADEVQAGIQYRADVKMENDWKAGRVSNATYRAYLEKSAVKYKYSAPSKYAQIMQLAKGVTTGQYHVTKSGNVVYGAASGGGGSSGGSSTTYKMTSPSGIEGMTIAETLKEIHKSDPRVPTKFKNKTAAGQFLTAMKNKTAGWQAIIDEAAAQGPDAVARGSVRVVVPANLLDPNAKPGTLKTITVTDALVHKAVVQASKDFKTINYVQTAYRYSTKDTQSQATDLLTKASNFHTPTKETASIYRDNFLQNMAEAGSNPDPAKGAAQMRWAIKNYQDQYQNQYSKLTTKEQQAKKLGATAQNDLRHNNAEWQDVRTDKAAGLGANMGSPVMQGWTQDLMELDGLMNETDKATDASPGSFRFVVGKALADNKLLTTRTGYPVINPDGSFSVVIPAEVSDSRDPETGLPAPENPKAPGGNGSWKKVIVQNPMGGFSIVRAPVTETPMGLKYASLKYSEKINGQTRRGRVTSDELATFLKDKKMTLNQAVDAGLVTMETDKNLTTKRVVVGNQVYLSNPLTGGWVPEENAWRNPSDFGMIDNNSDPENDLQAGLVMWTRDANGNFIPVAKRGYSTGQGELPTPVFGTDGAGAQAFYNANRAVFEDPSTTVRTYDSTGRPMNMPEAWYQFGIGDALDPPTHGEERSREDFDPTLPGIQGYKINPVSATRISAAVAADKRRAARFGDVFDRQAAEETPVGDAALKITKAVQDTLAKAFGLGSSEKDKQDRAGLAGSALDFAIKNKQNLPALPPKRVPATSKPTMDRLVLKPVETFSGAEASKGITDNLIDITSGPSGLIDLAPVKTTIKPGTLAPIKMPVLSAVGKSSTKTTTVTAKPKPIKAPTSVKATQNAQKLQNSGKNAKVGAGQGPVAQ